MSQFKIENTLKLKKKKYLYLNFSLSTNKTQISNLLNTNPTYNKSIKIKHTIDIST